MQPMKRVAAFCLSASLILTPVAAAADEQFGRYQEQKSYERLLREYENFLVRLQAAFRADDREAVIAMVHFPFRIHHDGERFVIRDAAELRRRFDWAFDEATVAAVLDHDPKDIFSRDTGAMVGQGELWFDRRCRNEDCTLLTPVRIISVNHIAGSD